MTRPFPVRARCSFPGGAARGALRTSASGGGRWLAPAAALAAVLLVAPLAAQQATGGSAWSADLVPVDPWAAPTPFGPGEHLVYDVKVGMFAVGDGHLTVEAVDSVRGHETYRAVMGIDGSLMGPSVDDEYTTWFDVGTLQSRRCIRHLHEITYESYRHYEFHPERREWVREDNGETGPLSSTRS